jgi:hypothetical protein
MKEQIQHKLKEAERLILYHCGCSAGVHEVIRELHGINEILNQDHCCHHHCHCKENPWQAALAAFEHGWPESVQGLKCLVFNTLKAGLEAEKRNGT